VWEVLDAAFETVIRRHVEAEHPVRGGWRNAEYVEACGNATKTARGKAIMEEALLQLRAEHGVLAWMQMEHERKHRLQWLKYRELEEAAFVGEYEEEKEEEPFVAADGLACTHCGARNLSWDVAEEGVEWLPCDLCDAPVCEACWHCIDVSADYDVFEEMEPDHICPECYNMQFRPARTWSGPWDDDPQVVGMAREPLQELRASASGNLTPVGAAES